MTGKPILLLPCSGIEKITGQLSSFVVLEALKKKTDLPISSKISFGQLSVNVEDAQKIISNYNVVAINGCGQQCVNKLLATMSASPSLIISVAQLIKGKPYAPKNNQVLTDKELEIVPTMAEDLLKLIQINFLNKPINRSILGEKFEFKPNYSKILEFAYTKFYFKVPEHSKLWYTWNDGWGFEQDGLIVIGITDYLQKNISDVMVADIQKVGTKVEQMDPVATIESSKTVVELLSPFSGEIIAINQKLEESPELINISPYEAGWVCILKPLGNLDEERENLLNPEGYFEEMKKKVENDSHK